MLVAAGSSIRWLLAAGTGGTQKGATTWINALAVAE